MVGIMSKKEREAMLSKVRKKMKERSKSKRDEFEFRMAQAAKGEEISFYVRILPELTKGEKCQGGIASRNYDYYFMQQGAHWINNKKLECPRLHDEQECPVCTLGFELLNAENDQDKRREISKKYLPRNYFSTNIYILDHEKNPKELRGKVMWYSMPKTIFDILDKCLCNDDPGDEDDPKAYGIFYDAIDGYVLKIHATKKGDYNTYESTKFLPATKGPLAKNKDGEPDEERIQEILDRRHDLATKFDDRNLDKLKNIVKELVSGGDDEDGGFDDDEEKEKDKDKEEIVEETPKESGKKSGKKAAKKEEKVEEETEEKIEDDVEDPELNSLLDEIKGDD